MITGMSQQALPEVGVEEGLERGAEQRRRDDAHHQQPGEPAVGVIRERALPQRRPASGDEAQHVAPEVDQQRHERARRGA